MSSPNASTELLLALAPALPERREFDYRPPSTPLNILHCDEDLLVVDKPAGLLSVPGRELPNRPRQMVSWEHGKPSLTDWEVISRGENSTRLALHPITGRSHQLRVHCWAIGHPILGDRIYALDEIFDAAPHLQLHAQKLGLRHPKDGTHISFESACPF